MEACAALVEGPAPITPPQDEQQRQQRHLPAPKALEADFDGLSVSGTQSPCSPSSSSSERAQRGAQCTPPSTVSDSDDCAGSSSGDLAAAAAAAGPHLAPPKWRQAQHDLQEPILSPSSERFCLLPVK